MLSSARRTCAFALDSQIMTINQLAGQNPFTTKDGSVTS